MLVVYVYVAALTREAEATQLFVLLLALGFVLGAVVARWWIVLVGALVSSTLVGPDLAGDWTFFMDGGLLPGSVAFGVLGERLRRSDSDEPIAGRVAIAGAVLLLIGVVAFVVIAGGYNDDAPVSAGVGLSFLVVFVALPFGVGLFCAGILGSFRRGRSD